MTTNEEDVKVIADMLRQSAASFLDCLKLVSDPALGTPEHAWLTANWTPAVTAGLLLKLVPVDAAIRHAGQAFLYLLTASGHPLEKQAAEMVRTLYSGRLPEAHPALRVIPGGRKR